VAKIKVGNCGWSYFSPRAFIENWREKYASRIAAYASMFSTVEVDSMFYKLPKVSIAEKWYKEASSVNSSFEFVPKAPKSITHNNFDVSDMPSFLDSAKALKADKILFQTPPSFVYSEKNQKTIEAFFSGLDSDFLPMWEPRGDWLSKGASFIERFAKKGIVIVVDPLRNKAPEGQEVYYFRLHGFGKKMMYSYKFTDSDLEKVRTYVKSLQNAEEIYVMFNNIYMYEDSLRFAKMIGV